MNQNALLEWMKFYDKQVGGGGMEGNSAYDEGGWTRLRNQDNNRARRMMFAKQMMGGGMGGNQGQDFFGGMDNMQQPMDYVAPQRNALALMMRGR